MLFMPCYNWKTSLSIKFYGYLFFSTTMLLLSCFEKIMYVIYYLHNNSAILKGFKIQLCNGAVLNFFNFLQLNYLIASPKLSICDFSSFLQKKFSLRMKELQNLSGNMFSIYQGFIKAILMSGKLHKKLNLLIEFSNSFFIKCHFKACLH